MKRLALLVLLMVGAIACADATVIKVATVAPEGTAWMRELRAAAEAVKKDTDGRVEIKYYPGGVMGDEPTVMRKIRIGQLQGGAFTGGELSGINKDAQIYSLPFLFRDLDEVDAVRAELDPLLEASFAPSGFVVAGISGGGFAYLMSTRDIRTREQLKAAKVWVPQGDNIAELAFKVAGVTPIPLPLTDVYTSLQTGLIDTVENTAAGAIAFQWHTKVKYMVDLPLSYVVGMLVIDKKVFDTLSADDQKAVHDDVGAAFKRLEATNRKDNQDALAALKKQGVSVFTPNAEEKKSWATIGDESYQKLVADKAFTPAMLEALQKALHAVRGTNR